MDLIRSYLLIFIIKSIDPSTFSFNTSKETSFIILNIFFILFKLFKIVKFFKLIKSPFLNVRTDKIFFLRISSSLKLSENITFNEFILYKVLSV